MTHGFVQNLARPGGNATGFTIMEPTTTGKWLELLKEIAPRSKPSTRGVSSLKKAVCYLTEVSRVDISCHIKYRETPLSHNLRPRMTHSPRLWQQS